MTVFRDFSQFRVWPRSEKSELLYVEFNTHYGNDAKWYWDQAGPDDTDWYPEEVPCPCLDWLFLGWLVAICL